MWYVNIRSKAQRDKIELRYVLTIWYVNKFKPDKSNLHIVSYVLTMWYVNEYVFFKLTPHTSAMY